MIRIFNNIASRSDYVTLMSIVTGTSFKWCMVNNNRFYII